MEAREKGFKGGWSDGAEQWQRQQLLHPLPALAMSIWPHVELLNVGEQRMGGAL